MEIQDSNSNFFILCVAVAGGGGLGGSVWPVGNLSLTPALGYHCVYLTVVSFLFFFRLEVDIEPVFACMALYDCKEKKKVFETSITLSKFNNQCLDVVDATSVLLCLSS